MKDIQKTKERDNIMPKPSSWKVLKELERVLGKSASEIIETALWIYVSS